MSALADFLGPRVEGLTQRWVAHMAEELSPRAPSERELREQAAGVVRALMQALTSRVVPPGLRLAREHGRARFQSGFRQDVLVREYASLRRLVLDLLEEEQQPVELADMRYLSDFVSSAINDAVSVFEQLRASSTQDLYRELREREEQLRAVLESTSESILGLDRNGRCTFANPAAARLLGHGSTSEMLGRDMRARLRPGPGRDRDEARMSEVLARVIASGAEVRGDDGEVWRHDGVSIRVRYAVSPRRSEGQVVGAVVTLGDLTEQRRAEQVLLDAKLRSDEALTAGSVATYTWDILGDRVYGDANLTALFGLRLDASRSAPIQHFINAIHRDDRLETAARIEHTLRTGEPYRTEYRTVVEGRERWVVARGRVEHDAEGQPVRFIGVIIDITERRRAEEAQRQLSQRLATALEVASLGTYEWNLRTGQVQRDERARAILGPGASEWATATEVFTRLDPAESAQMQADFERSLVTGHRLNADFTVTRPDGEQRRVRSAGSIVREPDGRPVCVFGFILDITEQVAQQRQLDALVDQLRAGQDELRQVFDALPLLVSFVAKDERYGLVNQAYEEWYGVPREQVIGRSVREMLGEDAYAMFHPFIRRALGGEGFTIEQRAVPYQGRKPTDVRATFVPRRDAHHRVEGYVLLVQLLGGQVLGGRQR